MEKPCDETKITNVSPACEAEIDGVVVGNARDVAGKIRSRERDVEDERTREQRGNGS